MSVSGVAFKVIQLFCRSYLFPVKWIITAIWGSERVIRRTLISVITPHWEPQGAAAEGPKSRRLWLPVLDYIFCGASHSHSSSISLSRSVTSDIGLKVWVRYPIVSKSVWTTQLCKSQVIRPNLTRSFNTSAENWSFQREKPPESNLNTLRHHFEQRPRKTRSASQRSLFSSNNCYQSHFFKPAREIIQELNILCHY